MHHYYYTVMDEVAEWLRRWTANPMGFARVGSNPISVVNIFYFFEVKKQPLSQEMLIFVY